MTTQLAENAEKKLEPWIDAILLVARTLGIKVSPETVRSEASWAGQSEIEDTIVNVAASAGLSAQFSSVSVANLSPVMLPALIPISANHVGMVVSVSDGNLKLIISVSGQPVERFLPIDQLNYIINAPVLLIRERETVRDNRIDDYLVETPNSWLLDIFRKEWRTIGELCLGSPFGNLLAIATSLFAMQVWDRVVPARSMETLWVLASGVGLAMVIEFGIRTTRIMIADHFGKKADLKLSAMFFNRVLDIKNDARPKSPGTLISQLRDLEQVRELLTSSTMGVLIDLPFVFAFLFIIWSLGGVLAVVPMAAIPLLIVPALLIQFPLAKLSNEGLSEAALRNALLMEAIHRVEDIKVLQAEPRFRKLWNRVNRVSGLISVRQRFLSGVLMNYVQAIQQLAYVGVVIAGVYLILNNDLSFGAVLACSILTSRTIAPIGQITGILTRLQNAKVGKRGLDTLLQLPVDHDPRKDAYHRPVLRGDYVFENVIFGYSPDDKPSIRIPSLKIKPGEKIAILGQIGSGKTTLLRLLGGLSQPVQGRILFNALNMISVDVADVRRDVGFLLQDSSLFYGTLRENLLIGSPLASDEDIISAMKISCADRLLLNQPHGLDLIVREGGRGLSGGQKQSLILARTILRSPQILLLDEPTASMDEATERSIIESLKEWLGPRTLILATHRYPILSLVDRIIVLDQGKIVADGPRDELLIMLTSSGNRNLTVDSTSKQETMVSCYEKENLPPAATEHPNLSESVAHQEPHYKDEHLEHLVTPPVKAISPEINLSDDKDLQEGENIFSCQNLTEKVILEDTVAVHAYVEEPAFNMSDASEPVVNINGDLRVSLKPQRPPVSAIKDMFNLELAGCSSEEKEKNNSDDNNVFYEKVNPTVINEKFTFNIGGNSYYNSKSGFFKFSPTDSTKESPKLKLEKTVIFGGEHNND